MQSSDLNTRAFHNDVNGHKKKKALEMLQDDNVVSFEKGKGLEEVVQSYFMNLFSRQDGDYEEVIGFVNQKVTDSHNQMLMAPFTAKEVQADVFPMHRDKAPGEDGFNPTFFQKFWPMVGNDVMAACLFWLEFRELSNGINSTNIVLLPKKNQPVHMKDLIPISLCNVSYKITANALANRLKVILPEVTSNSKWICCGSPY